DGWSVGMNRGFFEIGIIRGKCPMNVGTLWRSAFQMGASGIFTIGKRYPNQCSDTVKAYRHIPCREFSDIDAFVAALPQSWRSRWTAGRLRISFTLNVLCTCLARRILESRQQCLRGAITLYHFQRFG